MFRIINKDTMDIINDLNGKIEFKQEEMPLLSDVKLLLEDYINKLNSSSKVEFDFNKLIDVEHLFNKTSENGLEFILGYNDESGELIKLYVDDANTHYLIGGTTGSGKSNLLHNLILSACSRYSPKNYNYICWILRKELNSAYIHNRHYHMQDWLLQRQILNMELKFWHI